MSSSEVVRACALRSSDFTLLHIISMGVEIRQVGWQEASLRSDLCDQFKGSFVFVGTEVVHDDDVSGAKGWHKNLAEISL